jgi:dihydroorotate dehydrogenase (NAD+) catalytic subunit
MLHPEEGSARRRSRARLAPVSVPDTPSANNPSPGVDLRVAFGGLQLSNPILAASGTFGYGVEFAHLVNLNRLGGVVVKGLSLNPMEGAPAPRLCETAGGMMNAVGLQNIGVRAFLAEKLPVLRGYGTAIVANVFGYTPGAYAEVLRILEDAEGLAAYELNISCPNTERGGAEFGLDPGLAGQVVAVARKAATRRPLWVKLAPTVGRIGEFARAAENAGADALTIANTYPALRLDIRTGKSRLGNGFGGLSGPAIKPVTLRLVHEARKATKLPIAGLGGIETVEDVLEYMMAGATAVQVGTAHFVDPRASVGLVDGLAKTCLSLKYNRIIDIQVYS